MKVKCVNNFIEKPSAYRVYNSDMREFLQLGSLYWVYGIQFYKNVTYVYIFNDYHLFEVPIDFFEVVDNNVSSKWNIKVWEDGNITLWPDLFYQDGFLENFAEWEPYERKLFEDLRNKTEKPCSC